MNFRVSGKLKFTFVILSFFILIFGLSNNLSAQNVRLRSQITPTCTGSENTRFADIYADGNIAVQGSYSCRGAFIYDITNPDAPVLASHYNPGGNQQFLEAIVVGNRGYFAAGGTSAGVGVHIVDLTNPYSPVLLGTVDPTHGNGYRGIHEMVVFDQNGATYLVENYNQSSSSFKLLRFINVTNPANPVFIRDVNPTDTRWVHAVHIRGNKMYTSGWDGRIDIFDISNIGTQAPTLLGTIVGNSTNHSSWTSEDGNYLYSCRETFDGDLRVYDVSNPAVPFLVKSIKAGDLGLNAVSPHNPVVAGKYLYVAWYQAGIQIFDISKPHNPIYVGQYDTYQETYAPPSARSKSAVETEPWDLICGDPNRKGALPSTYDGNWAVHPFLGQRTILAGDLRNGLIILDVSRIASLRKNRSADFSGDGKTDLSVYTPKTGMWQIEDSSSNVISTTHLGLSEDIPVAGDYDGDEKGDVAVFRPSSGVWYVQGSTKGFFAQRFGLKGDVPTPGDFDADGKTDLAVFRPSDGTWYIQQSTLGTRIVRWGMKGDKAFTGDFEGDGKSDLVIYRPSNGTWYVLQSSSSIPMIVQYGISTDKPLSADFDGDGKSEFAVYRPSEGNWYIFNLATKSSAVYRFGLAEDMPIPADYDGDGKADIAVFRPSDNVWYRLNSSDGAFSSRAFGQRGDKPSPTSGSAVK